MPRIKPKPTPKPKDNVSRTFTGTVSYAVACPCGQFLHRHDDTFCLIEKTNRSRFENMLSRANVEIFLLTVIALGVWVSFFK